MAVSKQTYECYRCRDNGFPNTRVYLDGKTETGKTIYKNEDMSLHQHKTQQSTQQVQEVEQPIDKQSLQAILQSYHDSIDSKLDKIISLLERD